MSDWKSSSHGNSNRQRSNFSRSIPLGRNIPPYVYIPIIGTSGILAYSYYSFLDEAPFTRRKRLLVTSPSFERQLGDQEYQKLLRQFRGKVLAADHRASITVARVGSRIAHAAEVFSAVNLPAGSKQGDPYTYTVVRSDMANAFVLPNNHVFVLTGLFKYVKDEDELAAVLGHEMAHNFARHAGEKLSRGLFVTLAARLSLLWDPTGSLYTIFLPAATLFSELPHSREAEGEADQIGLQLAAEACYDPRAARRVFSAMKNEAQNTKKNGTPPQFLSTHPSYDKRLYNFDKWMPEAMKKFDAGDGAKCRQLREQMRLARRRAAGIA